VLINVTSPHGYQSARMQHAVSMRALFPQRAKSFTVESEVWFFTSGRPPLKNDQTFLRLGHQRDASRSVLRDMASAHVSISFS
jgi:hypothetical protein